MAAAAIPSCVAGDSVAFVVAAGANGVAGRFAAMVEVAGSSVEPAIAVGAVTAVATYC